MGGEDKGLVELGSRPLLDYIITALKPQVGEILVNANRNLEHYRQISRRLAMAEGVDEAEARELAKEGCAVVWIDGGLHATEVLSRVTDEALQIYGGMGLMAELPLERFWRDARVERIWEGTSEIQRHIISRALLRPHEG